MGAKNSTERVFKNFDKMLGEDDDFLKKNKKEKKEEKNFKGLKEDNNDNHSLLSKPIVKGGCKQCALKNKK